MVLTANITAFDLQEAVIAEADEGRGDGFLISCEDRGFVPQLGDLAFERFDAVLILGAELVLAFEILERRLHLPKLRFVFSR